MSDRLTLLRPDDWHIHLRDGAVLTNTVADVARTFGRAIIMPNLVPPVRNAAEADGYRQRMEQMGLYLTPSTPEEFEAFVAAERRKWSEVIRQLPIAVRG